MIYSVAEKFKSLQGEGVYAGTPMAFIRFTGCSVGKRVCQHCDTDFDRTFPWRGGGQFTAAELLQWALPYKHICLTGGEPLDWDLQQFVEGTALDDTMLHLETSGTVMLPDCLLEHELMGYERGAWVCVSPKPGYQEDVVMLADEIKVIVPGLGNGDGWPQLEDAVRWARQGKVVFLQPRNAKFDVDKQNLMYVTDLLRDNPMLRLSTQLHKILKVQ